MNRRILVALGLSVTIVALGVLAGAIVLREHPSSADAELDGSAAVVPPGADEVAPPQGPIMRITDTTGNVEVKFAASDWRPVRPGDVLSVSDLIRTGPGASATIDVGTTATVVLTESSQLGASDISRTVSSVRLQGGRLEAQVRGEDGSSFRVQVRGSDVVASTENGQFSVLSDDRGRVTVASSEGRVKVTARGKSVALAGGEQSTVLPDRPPSDPQKVPPSLYLKVGKPRSLVLREKLLTLSGLTTPGAVVSVNGAPVDVAADGSFTARVALTEGANSIAVRAGDVLGRKQAELTRVTLDTSSRVPKSDVTWGVP